ncbi:16S rRNA (cytosine(1402)-N(4))-methyltransferase RsmH [Parvibium lacunae]|uniref:Ribosomal RNA small subunit methyltransferase H n=1 Tax=Parvibium lacunae TaxID=1888893 RepID=A0A368L238_9BURK|nr:16S rRNA (cytosine(1402)-N(4))-methyltransferase RsmH [Parvibium lacunae]RCS57563.1 16S rRNA (cytosine(1402)-N(4))-methyltransferase RsmH [Parvibium lacunae]
MTAAHQSVLLSEAVAALALQPDSQIVDGTFGRGGHSRAILAQLGERGRLLAFDKDPQAIAAAAEIEDARFAIEHAAFIALPDVLERRGWSGVDGVLLDLGISSPQIDQAERGFSFRLDGPLDMRMDNTQGLTAAAWLAQATEQEIREVIAGYGEERFAFQIAAAIVARRAAGRPLVTTRDLATLVAGCVRKKEVGQDPATRTFQAIRIHLNQELAQLPRALANAVQVLNVGGRLAVISFHSLEDRLVKQFMQRLVQVIQPPRGMPVRAADLPQPILRLVDRIKPSAAEVAANPRARSAILRVAEKCREPSAAEVGQLLTLPLLTPTQLKGRP